MDVGVTELRSDLKHYLELARTGADVMVTDRGLPVARLTAVNSEPVLERLTREGVIGLPAKPRRQRAASRPRVTAQGSVSGLVSDQRR